MTYLFKCVEGLAELKDKIYKAKEESHLNFVEIGELYNIPSSKVKELYTQAKDLRADGDYSWLEGLSNRAINQLKKTKYKDFNSLYQDVINDVIDLEDLPWIGRKVAVEVRKWCKRKPSKISIDERRIEQRRK